MFKVLSGSFIVFGPDVHRGIGHRGTDYTGLPGSDLPRLLCKGYTGGWVPERVTQWVEGTTPTIRKLISISNEVF